MREKVECANFEEQAILYAVSELPEEERARVEAHARVCAGCAATLAAETHVLEAITARGEAAERLDASGLLLARCRSELAEALDDACATPEGWKWRALLLPARWTAAFRTTLAFYPAWSAAALLMAGALAGLSVRAWYRQVSQPLPGQPVMTVSAAPRLSDQDLETMGVEGIRLEPQSGVAAPRVEVQLRSQRPAVVQGTADDAEVRRVLSYVVEHGERFDPGVRLDSLDVLRTRTADPDIRGVLCVVAQRDSNPAVRLKALEALQGFGADPRVRQVMLGVLTSDGNSGARIDALNELLSAPSALGVAALPLDAETMRVLRDRMQNDANSYVRQRSATALGQLTAAEPGATSAAGSPQR
jgi:hypothetical protein